MSYAQTYERRMRSPLLDASQGAEARLRERREAQELARHQPLLAREMGVGRQDIAGAPDVGLIDVNNAPASALTRLPGVDDTLATRIIGAGAQIDGFSSAEDSGWLSIFLANSSRIYATAPSPPALATA